MSHTIHSQARTTNRSHVTTRDGNAMTALETLLHNIDALKAQLDQIPPLQHSAILQALDIEYTYESNHIEGSTLTLRETDLIINKGLTVGGKSMREHLEAINHYEAVLFLQELDSAR